MRSARSAPQQQNCCLILGVDRFQTGRPFAIQTETEIATISFPWTGVRLHSKWIIECVRTGPDWFSKEVSTNRVMFENALL
jgi:hypothetical protein